MPVSKVQLVGGNFQDPEGNVLALGYLTMKLSQDEEVNSSLICAGIEIKIQLDASGNCVAGQYVWGNDQMLPDNSYYKVTGYTAAGQPAWGPNNQQVIGNGGTFDTGSWIPNQVLSWFPLGILTGPQGTTGAVGPTGPAGPAGTNASRTSAIFYTIDGGGVAITTGAKGQLNIPTACTVTGWVLTADQSGSAVVDVLRSTYAGFPTTASIAGSDKPTISSVQKKENLAISTWGSTALAAGDQIQFNVNSATTVQRLNVTLIVTVL